MLKELFRQNGYPDHVVNRCVDKKFSTWSSEKVIGPKKCPVYIRLPFIGDVTGLKVKFVKPLIGCHSTVDSRVIFESHRMLPKVQKDVIPAINLSFVAYEFTSECDARYVGRTSQRLVDRIRQNVPLAIRKDTHRCNGCCQSKQKCKANQPKPESDAAIGTHLLSSVECGNSYNEDCFCTFSRARKEFVFALHLF